MINTLKDIDTSTDEGKLLLASIAKITTESQTDKTPEEVIDQLNMLDDYMEQSKEPQPPENEIVNEFNE